MVVALISLFIGSLFGTGVGLWLFQIARQRRLQAAEAEAEAIVLDAKDRFEELMSEAREHATEYEDQIWSKNEKEVTQIENRVQEKEKVYRNKRSELDRSFHKDTKDLQKRAGELSEMERQAAQKQAAYDDKKAKLRTLKKNVVEKLQSIVGGDAEALKTQVYQTVENGLHIEAKKRAARIEDEARADAEGIAKRILSIVIGRFARASCTERGIGTVELESPEQKARLLGLEGANLKLLEQACGVDLVLTEDNTIAVAGYDPVRRELTTRCLEKLLKEKKIDAHSISRVVEKTKADLLRKIEEDGRRVANELNCPDLHVEVKKMMGALRYRYSFAQNQYFHCAEVGWLCGIIASEFGGGVKRKDAKRAGLLHDIGKAMDHSVDGGHAVIGAEFIQNHGEAAHIVHAVKAHHYEEQPSTDLAFLVIAADAISGARPGARRQTVNTYNQKIEALSTIGDGFPGVLRTMIFNAGREVRVVVDARKINDQLSLKLCRDIADKIEDECSYPGQIKVVVVRETVAEATAK